MSGIDHLASGAVPRSTMATAVACAAALWPASALAQTTPTTTAAPPASTSAPATTVPPAQAPQSSGDGSARVGLVVVAAVVLAALILFAIARWWAWEPRWLVRWRHATGEAGWRASNAWAEFTDWLRLGR